jgi:hypothetical protein
MRLAGCGGKEPIVDNRLGWKAVDVSHRLVGNINFLRNHTYGGIQIHPHSSQVVLLSLPVYLLFIHFSRYPTFITLPHLPLNSLYTSFVYYSLPFFKMATTVMQPLSSLSLDREIMPPSPVSQNSSRHGRSRHGGSVVKGKARGRGYSIVDERDVMISKALNWVLKRTVQEDEEQEEGEEKLVADAEGWVNCEEVVRLPLKPHFPRSSNIQNSSKDPTFQLFKSHLQSCKPSFPPPPPKLASLSNSTPPPKPPNQLIPPTTSFAPILLSRNPPLPQPLQHQPSPTSQPQPKTSPTSSSTKPPTPTTP